MAILNENFTLAELKEYIRTCLSGSIWRIEGMGLDQLGTIDAAISDALMAYGRRVPIQKFRILQTTPAKREYDVPDIGYGVARVDFIQRNLLIAPLISSTLGFTPILNMEARDFDTFQRWRKTFQRVTSTDCKWQWDEERGKLMIYAPTLNIMAGVVTYHPRSFEQVRLVHKDFIKRYSLAKARLLLGEARSKFGSTIPGPSRDINVNGNQLKDDAKAEIEKLDAELFSFQMRPVMMWT